MSSKKTTNYGLHLWEPDDKFLRTEFNENSSKIDAAVAACNTALTAHDAKLAAHDTALSTYRTHTLLLDKTTASSSTRASIDLTNIDFTAWHKLEGRFSLPRHNEEVYLRVNGRSDEIYYRAYMNSHELTKAYKFNFAANLTKTGSERIDVGFTLPLYLHEWESMIFTHMLGIGADWYWNIQYMVRINGISWTKLTSIDVDGDIPSGTHIQLWGVT